MILKIVFTIIASLQLGSYNKPSDKLTLNEVYEYMLKKDILYADEHLRIIVVEVGWLKHINHKNNLCNWRNKSGYLTFNHWGESIDYLKIWQDKHYSKYLETHKPGDYWDFIHWVGYVDGKRYSARGKRYVDYCRKIQLNL